MKTEIIFLCQNLIEPLYLVNFNFLKLKLNILIFLFFLIFQFFKLKFCKRYKDLLTKIEAEE